jgi:hypothetical protein
VEYRKWISLDFHKLRRITWMYNIKMDIEREDEVVCTGLIWLGIGTSGGICEHGNEISCSVKCYVIVEQLHNWRILKKGSSP